MPKSERKCSICGEPIEIELLTGWTNGHNARPINSGRCCSVCNDMVVIPHRIETIYNRIKKPK